MNLISRNIPKICHTTNSKKTNLTTCLFYYYSILIDFIAIKSDFQNRQQCLFLILIKYSLENMKCTRVDSHKRKKIDASLLTLNKSFMRLLR